jgi:hypothetical protein
MHWATEHLEDLSGDVIDLWLLYGLPLLSTNHSNIEIVYFIFIASRLIRVQIKNFFWLTINFKIINFDLQIFFF